VFDRSARFAEHLANFLFDAEPLFSRRSLAIVPLFGLFDRTFRRTLRLRVCKPHFRGERIERRDKAMVTMTPERILLTPKQAAAALSISTRTLWSLTDRGQLPAVRIGRAVRYSIRDLESWIARRRTQEEN
jgi:excisionase family DNA binding protein